VVKPVTKEYQFKTTRAVPKLGVMLVGLGGNNGSTLTAGLIANREGLKWRTPGGEQSANYFGSLLQVRSRCEQSRLTSHGKTASKTQVMILCLGVPNERFFSSLVFNTVATALFQRGSAGLSLALHLITARQLH
jgi:hypothetical protein